MSNTPDWLQNLKARDIVLVSHSSRSSVPEVRTVDRVTATQITVGSTKYRRENGREIGRTNSYHWSLLLEPTPEAVEKAQRNARILELRRSLTDTQWNKVSLEAMETIWRIVGDEAVTELLRLTKEGE